MQTRAITGGQDKHLRVLYFTALICLLGLTAVLYQSGISGPYLLDDVSKLSRLADYQNSPGLAQFIQLVFGDTAGPSGRPVAIFSFFLQSEAWPDGSGQFKAVNVLLHLLCGIVLARCTYLISGLANLSNKEALLLSLLTSALWLLHPFNLSTTLYVVQRMTQLMTLFALLAICFYIEARKCADGSANRRIYFYLGMTLLCSALSILSKENGILVFVVIAAIGHLFHVSPNRNSSIEFAAKWLPYLPLIAISTYLLVNWSGYLVYYEYREFSLSERLLTQPRVLLHYLYNILIPLALDSSLFHDDFVVSKSFLEPLSTLFAIAVLVSLLLVAVRTAKNQPVFCLAVFWFLGFHLLESSFIGLELYYEHRNYMAMIGPLYAVAYYLLIAFRSSSSMPVRSLVVVCATTFLATSAIRTEALANDWGRTSILLGDWANQNSESLRSQLSYANFLDSTDDVAAATEYFERAVAADPNELTTLIHRWNFECKHNLTHQVSLREISERADLHYYNGDINQGLVTMLEGMQASRCVPPAEADVTRLFEQVLKFSMSTNRRSMVFYNFAALAVLYQDLDSALSRLSEAYAINPNAQFPIRQANLLAMVGDTQSAREYLDLAREADSQRSFSTPSVSQSINELNALLVRIEQLRDETERPVTNN